MPETQPEVYSASVNPPRRAKRGPLPPPASQDDQPAMKTASTTNPVRQILPTKPYTPRTMTASVETSAAPPPPAPAKRGRKPGPLSRSAREAQRRLNHSIIEKARRTKINDALATLRQLVPVNYGQKSKPVQQDESSDEEDEDEEYLQGSDKKSKAKPKSGKREEKEKEFKLEILVRTVAFLQDLLKRVDVLEGEGTAPADPKPVEALYCQNCGAGGEQRKRKRTETGQQDDSDDTNDRFTPDDAPQRPTKVRRNTIEEITHQLPPPSSQESTRPTYIPSRPHGLSNEHITPHHYHHQHAHGQNNNRAESIHTSDSNRLPPIASWLPNAMIDPRLLPPSSSDNGATHNSYLPSPPSSTHFDPVRSSKIPPVLNLGPTATERGSRSPPTGSNYSSSSSARTPEDESAASLLLQMASPPTFRGGSGAKKGSGTGAYSGLTEPSNFVLHSSSGEAGRSRRDMERVLDRDDDDYRRSSVSSVRQAQTPGSMLGIQHHRGLRGSS